MRTWVWEPEQTWSTDAAMALLDADERAALAAMRPTRAGEHAAGRMLAKLVLAAETDTDPHGWSIRADAAGRPRAWGPVDADVSISHGGGLIAVTGAAGHRTRVGVDVEDLRRTVPIDALARRFFADGDLEWIAGADGVTARRLRCFVVWSAKEAVGKLTGHGLAATLSAPFVACGDEGADLSGRPEGAEVGMLGAHRVFAWIRERHVLVVAGAVAQCPSPVAVTLGPNATVVATTRW